MSSATKLFGFKSSWKKIFYISVKKVSLRNLYSQVVGLILNTLLSHVLNVIAAEGVYNGKC